MKVHVHTGLSYPEGVCEGCLNREKELKRLRRVLAKANKVLADNLCNICWGRADKLIGSIRRVLGAE